MSLAANLRAFGLVAAVLCAPFSAASAQGTAKDLGTWFDDQSARLAEGRRAEVEAEATVVLEEARTRKDAARAAAATRLLAVILYDRGFLGASVALTEEALRLLRTSGDEATEAFANYGYARTLAAAGRVGEAKKAVADSIASARDLEESETLRLARALESELGGDGATAAVSYERVADSLLKSGRALAALTVGCEAANARLALGDAKSALARLDSELAAARSRGWKVPAARIQHLRAMAFTQLNQTGAAVEALDRAVELADEMGMRGFLGMALSLRAFLGAVADRSAGAVDDARRALAIDLELGETRRTHIARALLARALCGIGAYGEANEEAETALAEAMARRDPMWQGSATVTLGCVALGTGEFDLAVRRFTAAETLFASLGRTDDVESTRDLLVTAYAFSGRTAEAVAMARTMVDRYRVAGNIVRLATGLHALGECARADGQQGAAREALAESARLFDTIGMSRESECARGLAAFIVLEEGDAAASLDGLAATAARLDGFGDRMQAAWSYVGLARARRLSGNTAAALVAARRAFDLSIDGASGLSERSAVSLREGLLTEALDEALLAALAAGLGDDSTQAASMFELIESARGALLVQALTARGPGRNVVVQKAEERERELIRDNVRKLADCWLARGDHVSAGDAAELRRSLDRSERRLAELAAGRETAVRRARRVAFPKAAPLAEIRALLPSKGAFVSFRRAGEKLIAVVVTPTTVRLRDLGASRPIGEAIDAWRRALAAPGAAEARSAGRVGAALFGPLEADLAGLDALIVIPDGDLAFAPIEALVVDVDGSPRRLIERFRISYAPSATALVALAAGRSAAPPGKRLLLLGDPTYPGEAAPVTARLMPAGATALPRLAATGDEVRGIADLVESERRVVLTREAASRSNLLERFAAKDPWLLVHVAAHGVMNDDRPLTSGIALAGGEMLTLDDLLTQELRADLVVLAACDSGRGPTTRSEGVRGLVRGFLGAGALRVLVAGGRVDDRATRDFMLLFYKKLLGDHLPPAMALRAARLETIAAKGAAAHPSAWSSFMLWGLPE